MWNGNGTDTILCLVADGEAEPTTRDGSALMADIRLISYDSFCEVGVSFPSSILRGR